MNSYVAWNDIRSEHVERAGSEAAVDAGKHQMLAEVIGRRLAEVRRARDLTQQQVADRMGSPRAGCHRSSAERCPDKTSSLDSPQHSAATCTERSISTTATSRPSLRITGES